MPDKTKITFQLTESGPYDTDDVDTTITDPSGPGASDVVLADPTVSTIPTLSTWAWSS